MDTKERVNEHGPRSHGRTSRTRLSLDALEPRLLLSAGSALEGALDYAVVDTGQTTFYSDSGVIAEPTTGGAFHGQDAQYTGNAPNYDLSADGLTIADNVTSLTWQQSADTGGDGDIDSDDKLTWSKAQSYADTLNAQNYGGYRDWRLPNIKELYSLIDFSGIDPSGYNGTDTSGLVPFIDTNYFDFGYGDTAAGERIIDAQYWSSTEYVSTTMNGDATTFGVNFADGSKGTVRATPEAERRPSSSATCAATRTMASTSSSTTATGPSRIWPRG